MLRGINQQQIYEDTEDYKKFIEIIKGCQVISGFKLYAYCLMSNHVHILLKIEKEELEQVFKRIGSRYVYWYNTKYRRSGHLFQDRFKSEPVEDEKYFITVLRYIHQNPIKAGICKSLGEYLYSSYNEYIESNGTVDRDFVYGIISKEFFEEYHQQLNMDRCLELEAVKIRLTDEQAKKIVQKKSQSKSISGFLGLDEIKKEKYVKDFYTEGLSVRQISRLTGLTKGMVEKCLKS